LTRQPAFAVDAPAFILGDFFDVVVPLRAQFVDVEKTVQVIKLVLEYSCKPALSFDFDWVLIEIDSGDCCNLCALKRKSVTRERQAAFGLFIFVGSLIADWA